MSGIHAVTPFTLLDYPGELACIVWFPKCNLRCVYCHNRDIVLGQVEIDDATFEAFLENRKTRLTAVVLSGGEPTFCPDILHYAQVAKAKGYKVKLDTNGSNPNVVKLMLDQGLADAVALDYKAMPNKLAAIVGTDQFATAHQQTLRDLIDVQKTKPIYFEVRTTYHADLMTPDDLNAIMADLEAEGFTGSYYIQDVMSTGDKTLGNIPEPQGRLDPTLLKKPSSFKVGFRNFKYIPESA